MDLQEVIKSKKFMAEKIRKAENIKHNREIYVNLSLLQGLDKLYGDKIYTSQNYVKKIMFLNDEINRWILIVRRLHNYNYEDFFEDTYSKKYVEMQIDTLSFLHFSYSILNVVAKITGIFFQGIRRFKSKSFNNQRTYFMINKNVDKEYSDYLSNQTGWYADFHLIRKIITHHTPPLFIPNKKGVQLVIMKGALKSAIFDLPDYLYLISNELFRLLVFFDSHFYKKHMNLGC